MRHKKRSIFIDSIQLKRGTALDLWELNPILLDGEPCFEKDTGRIKIGDGFKKWRELPYLNGGYNSAESMSLAKDSEVTTVIENVFSSTKETQELSDINIDGLSIATDEEVDSMLDEAFGG